MTNPFGYLFQAHQGARLREILEAEERRLRRRQQGEHMVERYWLRRAREDQRNRNFFHFARMVVKVLQDLREVTYPDRLDHCLISEYQKCRIHLAAPDYWSIWREYYAFLPGPPTGECEPNFPRWTLVGENQVSVELVYDRFDCPDHFLVSRVGRFTCRQTTPLGMREMTMDFQPLSSPLSREGLIQALIALHPPEPI